MSESETKLSRSLEDYLEAIHNLKHSGKTARVKDIAVQLGVKMPSVTEAIQTLAAKGLVKHKPYGEVELTAGGADLAQGVAGRHDAVRDFLVGVLGLDEAAAEREACGIEHSIRPETLDKLRRFVDFVRVGGDDPSLRLSDFRRFVEHGRHPVHGEIAVCPVEGIETVSLSDVEAGVSGTIRCVRAAGPIRKRLIEMGVTTGTSFEMIRSAPLGDPIEIKVRGYLLSLRIAEASQIQVEIDSK